MTTAEAASKVREVVAVIPARGGSKGVPGKNVALVGGVPLVVRAVRAAQAAERIDRVVVSTDDDAIAAAARAAGAEIIDRPRERQRRPDPRHARPHGAPLRPYVGAEGHEAHERRCHRKTIAGRRA